MLDNQKLRVSSDKVSLIPYLREHVDTYHGWMQDPYILEMTASEPLSFEEEIEMQESWANDSKKATFIVVRPSKSDGADEMIGDVNLFFNDYDDPKSAEINIMIARADVRGLGLGKEAVLLMLHYALTRLGVSRVFCKIDETNASSLRLFRGLGFSDVKYVAAFKEHELELKIGGNSASFLALIEDQLSCSEVTYRDYVPVN